MPTGVPEVQVISIEWVRWAVGQAPRQASGADTLVAKGLQVASCLYLQLIYIYVSVTRPSSRRRVAVYESLGRLGTGGPLLLGQSQLEIKYVEIESRLVVYGW